MIRKIIVLLVCLLVIPSALVAQERKKVALVLGGGGAKGAATVGVLKYVEQAGIPVDYVVGTSIGSIVGGLYCAGYRSEQLDSMFRSQDWLSLFVDVNFKDLGEIISGFNILKDSSRKMKNSTKEEKMKMGIGLLSGDSIVNAMRDMLRKSPGLAEWDNVDSLCFDSLPIPFRCVAVDVNEFSEVHLNHGSLATAMRASMAIPFVFRPIKKDGMTLVDGGVLNNLPVDVAKSMGADIIIAIDLTVDSHEGDNYITLPKGGDSIFAPLMKSGLFNLMRWGIERPDVKKYLSNVEMADVHINPNLKGYGAQSFTQAKVKEMIALGEEAGKAALDSLEKLKEKIYIQP